MNRGDRREALFDIASRLGNVTNAAQSATYSYVANSPLVDQIAFKQSSNTRMTTTKQFDSLSRLGPIPP